jgi:methylaspartate mutase sigma subunit
MVQRGKSEAKVLLSTVSSDAHSWNLVYLKMLLTEHGYGVDCLGTCVPDELLVHTARTRQPDVIVISTINGHGCLDGARLARRLREDPATAHIPAVIGGKLGIAGEDEAGVARLLAAGFTAVYHEADASVLIEDLRAIIESGSDEQSVADLLHAGIEGAGTNRADLVGVRT